MPKKLKKSPTKTVSSHRTRKTAKVAGKADETYLIIVRSWMLVVVFALMLGIGAIVGTFLRVQLEQGTPTVAGAQIQR